MLSPFLIASKLAWFILRPESWLFGLIVLGLWGTLTGRRRVAAWSIGGAALFFLTVALWPVAVPLLKPLESRYPVNPPITEPALILVLGGGEDTTASLASGTPAVNDRGDRFLAALALAHRFPEAKLGFTGGSGWFRSGLSPGAEVALRIYRGAGIEKGRLLLEGQSRNTWQNAVFTLPMIADLPPGPVVLVTSAFHMPRAVEVFCAAGWENIVPYPTDFIAAGRGWRTGWNFADNLVEVNLAVKEWVGIVAYRVTGRAEKSTLRADGTAACG